LVVESRLQPACEGTAPPRRTEPHWNSAALPLAALLVLVAALALAALALSALAFATLALTALLLPALTLAALTLAALALTLTLVVAILVHRISSIGGMPTEPKPVFARGGSMDLSGSRA
jgi:hypothetical protein